MQEKLRSQEQSVLQELEQARELAATHHYPQAMALLENVAAVRNQRMVRLAEAARAEIEKAKANEKRQKDLAAIALSQAEELLIKRSYEGAAQVLESIPEPLRTGEIASCLERARSHWQELRSLSGEIRAAIQDKRTDALLPKIERLLMLQPNHPQAQKLATQLRDQLVAAAKKRLNEHQYADALKLIEQIPSFAQNEETERLREQALELAALLMELRLTPLATAATLAVVQKLVKIAPGNQEAARQVKELEARIMAKPGHPRLAAPNWAALPKQTRVQTPVDWLGHFTRPSCDAAAAANMLRQRPGQFFVALGLALQGIEEADIALNLLPAEKSGILGKLPFSLGKRGAQAAWGLDLGAHALRAIKLTKDGKTGAVKVEKCEYLAHAQPLLPGTESGHTETATQTLRDFLGRAELAGSKVVLGLSGERVLGRFFDLPPLPVEKIAETVQYEARHQIPVPLEDLSWRYDLLGDAPTAAAKGVSDAPRRVVLVAARLVHVQAHVALCKGAGINLDMLVPDSLALHNAVRFEFEPDPDRSPIALLDIGLGSSNLVVSSRRNVWFRSFGLGGESFTDALVKLLQLTREQAEELKRNPARVRRFSLFYAAQEPLLVQLASEIERSLASYKRFKPTEPVERLYGIGGGFQTSGVLRYLRWGK